MRLLPINHLLPLLALVLLLSGCHTETLGPDTEERVPLFLRGSINNDSFLFTNESDAMFAECNTETIGDTVRNFTFSFTDKNSSDRKIEISFQTDIRRSDPSADSTIQPGDYEFTYRDPTTRRVAGIAWHEGGVMYATGNIFQPGIIRITTVDDITWDGIRYRKIQLTAFCTLFSSVGTVKQLADLSGQIVIRKE